MIARSALPFSARNILDRVFQSVTCARLHHYALLLFRGDEPPLASPLRRAFRYGRNGTSWWRTRLHCAHRTGDRAGSLGGKYRHQPLHSRGCASPLWSPEPSCCRPFCKVAATATTRSTRTGDPSDDIPPIPSDRNVVSYAGRSRHQPGPPRRS